PMETGVRPAPERTEIEAPAVKVVASRKRSSDAAGQKQAQNKQAPGKAKTKAGPPRGNRPGSKQARALARLGRGEGPPLAACLRAAIGKQLWVRGSFAGVVRKKLGLEVRGEKPDGGDRAYRIVPSGGARSDSRRSRRRAA